MLDRHPTIQLQEFIKQIVETKSKNEEDILIRRNLEFLKDNIKQKNIGNPKMIEYILRGIYSEMMGHSAEFVHFYAINLVQSKSILMKKIGYLACSLFLEENAELKILLVSPIQKDLESNNEIEIIIALNALLKLITSSFAETFVPNLQKLLKHKNILIKKKVINCIFRLEQLSPNIFPNYKNLINEWLSDPNVSILNVVLNIIYEETKKNPDQFLLLYKPICTVFEQILKNIGKFISYDNIPEPWIQVKILQIFNLFLNIDISISKYIHPFIMKSLDKSNDMICDVSYMVLYQNLLVLSKINLNEEDLYIINKIIHKFLSKKLDNPNLLYLGLKALKAITINNVECIHNHELFVIECLESRDDSIKRNTLDLLSQNAKQNNIKLIIDKLINSLESTYDPFFKKKITENIFELTERLSPNIEYFVNIIIKLLEISEEYIENDKITKLISIFNENVEFNNNFINFLIEKFYNLVYKGKPINDKIVKISVYVLSKYGVDIFESDKNSLEQILICFKNLLFSNLIEENSKLWIIQNIDKFSKFLSKEIIYCEKLNNYIKEINSNNEMELRLNLLSNNNINYDEENNFNFSFAFDYYSNPNLKEYDLKKFQDICDKDIKNQNLIKFNYNEDDNYKNKIGTMDETLIVNKKLVWSDKGHVINDKTKPVNKGINFINNMKNFKPILKTSEDDSKKDNNKKNKKIAEKLFVGDTKSEINIFNKKKENNKNDDFNIDFDMKNYTIEENKNIEKLEPFDLDPEIYWEKLENEFQCILKINKNENDFKQHIISKGFHLVSEIEKEFIFGAKYKNKIILLYIPFEDNSQIEYILKLENKEDLDKIKSLI